MSFALFAFLSLAVAQHNMKAVPYGQPLPVSVLFPEPTNDTPADPLYNETTEGLLAQHHHDGTSNELHIDTAADVDVKLIKYDDYLPYEVTKDQTLVYRDGGLFKRAAYRGRAKMNCKKSPQACQTACYYQNCIRAGQNVQYTEPGPATNSAGREQAGVTVSIGTPCQTWPFGQRFWDPIGTGNLGLQTDEWPMDSMQRPMFNPAATTPQVALRCIPGGDNGRGGNQIRQFRSGQGDWNSMNGGRFAADRRGAGPFVPGDTYEVEFYMGDFDMTDANDLAIYNTLQYCKPQPNCQNDGLQFHLTNLQLTPSGTAGLLRYPYDNALHNTYRLTGEPADIRQFQISLDITGQANDEVSARVFVYNNGAEDELAQRAPATLANGASFTLPVSNTLPKAIRVDNQVGCTDFTFTYGDPTIDGIRAFTFTSRDSGRSRWARDPARDGRYCLTEDIPDPNQQGQSLGTRLMCTFPAW